MSENGHHEPRIAGPRLFAIVGPFQSGKTSLLEAILARGGALQRQGSVREGTSVGDPSKEARKHAMSVEANVASLDYMGDRMTFFDCPGSVEFLHEMRPALPVCDAAVVVCEADPRKVPALNVILRELEDAKIPRFLFLNKIDQDAASLREALRILQPASRTPLLMRQMPIWEGGVVTGFIDLALERAFVYRRVWPLQRRASSRRRGAGGEAGALFHARKARRLRRCADGAIDRRHGAAARSGVRRSRARTARWAGGAAAHRLGGARPWRDPALESVAARSARNLKHTQASPS